MSDPLTRSGLSGQPGFLLRQASGAVWRDLTAALDAIDLKPQGYASLLLIAVEPHSKQQEVADALGIKGPNMVALIEGMIARGLITRGVNVTDRRSYALALTAEGKTLLERAEAIHAQHIGRIADLLTPDELEALKQITRKLIPLGE